MEEQQRLEIGQRIRKLREASPQTNRSIADFVGVGERAVANWIAGGGIAWEVCETDPAAGTNVEEGARVELVVDRPNEC